MKLTDKDKKELLEPTLMMYRTVPLLIDSLARTIYAILEFDVLFKQEIFSIKDRKRYSKVIDSLYKVKEDFEQC